ncbi:hypothetical protein LINPERHAP2_LOCUS16979 [Linum perenne]
MQRAKREAGFTEQRRTFRFRQWEDYRLVPLESIWCNGLSNLDHNFLHFQAQFFLDSFWIQNDEKSANLSTIIYRAK